MKKVISLSVSDLRNIVRDPILVLSMLGPLVIAAGFKFALPVAAELVKKQFAFDISVYMDFIMGLLLMFTPMLIGILIGFIILEERDENLVTYYSVTPLGKTGYIIYRILNPFIISLVFSALIVIFTGPDSKVSLKMVPVVLMASLEAPMITLLLGAFAGNRVEGLAFSKAFGVLFFGPLIGYFVKSGWQILSGIFPIKE